MCSSFVAGHYIGNDVLSGNNNIYSKCGQNGHAGKMALSVDILAGQAILKCNYIEMTVVHYRQDLRTARNISRNYVPVNQAVVARRWQAAARWWQRWQRQANREPTVARRWQHRRWWSARGYSGGGLVADHRWYIRRCTNVVTRVGMPAVAKQRLPQRRLTAGATALASRWRHTGGGQAVRPTVARTSLRQRCAAGGWWAIIYKVDQNQVTN